MHVKTHLKYLRTVKLFTSLLAGRRAGRTMVDFVPPESYEEEEEDIKLPRLKEHDHLPASIITENLSASIIAEEITNNDGLFA